jgi:hypothetical protein
LPRPGGQPCLRRTTVPRVAWLAATRTAVLALTPKPVAQMPAKRASCRLSSKANQAGRLEPSGCLSGSAKLVGGTKHR